MAKVSSRAICDKFSMIVKFCPQFYHISSHRAVFFSPDNQGRIFYARDFGAKVTPYDILKSDFSGVSKLLVIRAALAINHAKFMKSNLDMQPKIKSSRNASGSCQDKFAKAVRMFVGKQHSNACAEGMGDDVTFFDVLNFVHNVIGVVVESPRCVRHGKTYKNAVVVSTKVWLDARETFFIPAPAVQEKDCLHIV